MPALRWATVVAVGPGAVAGPSARPGAVPAQLHAIIGSPPTPKPPPHGQREVTVGVGTHTNTRHNPNILQRPNKVNETSTTTCEIEAGNTRHKHKILYKT